MLQKQRLRGTRLVVELGLSFLSFLAAERRVHQNTIVKLWCAAKEFSARFHPGQCIPVPDVRFIDTVQHEIREGDWVYRVVFFAAIKCAASQKFKLNAGDSVSSQ